jgi:hypothetical protein
METLAVMLGCLGVFAAGMIARFALVALVLAVSAAPVVAIVTGIMRAADVLSHRSGGWTPVHGLRR